MKKYINCWLAILAVACIVSCKGKDGTPGPAGKSVTNNNSLGGLLITEGSITGDYLGESGSKPLAFPINLTQVSTAIPNTMETDNSDSVVISISQFKLEIADNNAITRLNFDFKVKDLKNLSEAILSNISFNHTKEIDQTILNLSIPTKNFTENKPFTIGKATNLKYDPATSIMTGNFEITAEDKVFDTNTQKFITAGPTQYIRNGSFSSKLYKIVYNDRKAQN